MLAVVVATGFGQSDIDMEARRRLNGLAQHLDPTGVVSRSFMGLGDRAGPQVAVQQRCAAAERFLVAERGMITVTEPDTIDDWRTQQTVVGCRVTAAGVTTMHLASEAEQFYERLRAVGWTRTPEPRDAPNEASLRFRSGETDCLFNIYSGGIVGSAAEIEVNSTVVPDVGETRYNVLVQCMPAMQAAPRPRSPRVHGSG